MADIFGVHFPQHGIKANLAAIAVVSVPLALVVGSGYGIYRVGRALRTCLRTETDDEKVARMERVSRLDGVFENAAR